MSNPDFNPTYSTSDIWRGGDTTRCLTDDLDAMDAIHVSLPDTYAAKDHTHNGYAAADHQHATVDYDVTYAKNKKLYSVLPDGTQCDALNLCNNNGNTVVGYGHYDNGSGNTHIYGKSVNIYALNSDGTEPSDAAFIARNSNNHMLLNYTAGTDKNSSTYIYGNGVHLRTNDDDVTVDGIQLARTDKATITSLSSGWSVYSTNNTPTVRRYGNVVSLDGTLKNTSTVTLNATYVKVFTLPSGYRPSQEVLVVCQGSSVNRFMMLIKTDGSVNFGRYGTTSFPEVATGAWFPFHATWVME